MTKRVWRLAAMGACIACVTMAPGQVKKDDATVVKKAENLVEVTVTGMGMDKEEALRDAKRKAIENGAGTFIYSHSDVKDFALVKDTVIARAAGFVQSVEKLSEKQMEDETWEVRIKAVVSTQGIEDIWGVVTNLLKDKGRPKIMVFITEKLVNDKGEKEIAEDSTVQTSIEGQLLKSGFLLVEKNQIKEIDKKDLVAAATEDKPDKMLAIAKRFGAQLFISGTANATPGQRKELIPGRLYYTYDAEVNVKCYGSDTAKMYSAIPGKSTQGIKEVWRSAAKQALDAQGEQVAPMVRWDILRVWMDELQGHGEVKLEIDGMTYKQASDLEELLKKVKEAKDVNFEFANKVATYSIQSEVTAKVLAKKIGAIPGLDISDVTQNVIKATFKPEK